MSNAEQVIFLPLFHDRSRTLLALSLVPNSNHGLSPFACSRRGTSGEQGAISSFDGFSLDVQPCSLSFGSALAQEYMLPFSGSRRTIDNGERCPFPLIPRTHGGDLHTPLTPGQALCEARYFPVTFRRVQTWHTW
jgi:hypothetical protein